MLVAVLVLLATESAMAAGLPLPTVVDQAVPTVAPLLPPRVLSPIVPSVPTLPQLPPVPNLPAVPSVAGGPKVPAVPNVTGGQNLPAAPGREPSVPQAGGTPPARAPSGAPVSGGSGSASAGATAGAPAVNRSRAAAAVARRDRRLRTTVRRLQHCFGGLSRVERRVLVLRAGVGAGPPRSRATVARRLDVSARRVARIERRGLRRLRGLAGGGHCGAGDIAGGQAAAGAVAGSSPTETGPPGVLASGSADRTVVKAERESSSAPVPGSERSGVISWLPEAIVGGVDVSLPLLLGLALAGGLFAVRVVRRELGSRPSA